MNNSPAIPTHIGVTSRSSTVSGVRRWCWLATRRLLRHGQSRVMLLFLVVVVPLGFLNKFGTHPANAIDLMLTAMGLCYFPANLLWGVFQELGNVQSARLWTGLRRSGWVTFALLGVISISVFVWLSYPALSVSDAVLLGLLFYTGGLAPTYLSMTYLGLVLITFAAGIRHVALATLSMPVQLGVLGLAALFILYGVSSIERRWRTDYAFKQLTPRGGPIGTGILKRRDRALGGWQRGRIRVRPFEIAGALLFESGRKPPIAHRWKLICPIAFTVLIAIFAAAVITGHQGTDISGNLVAFVLAFSLMGLTLLFAPFLGMQAPQGRLLPVSRHMFARATWLAHAFRSGQYLILMGSLYTGFALLARYVLDIHTMATPQMVAALLTTVVPAMAMQQAAVLNSDISTLVMNGRWNATFTASLGRLLFNLGVLLVAGTSTLAALFARPFVAAMVALLTVLIVELWLIWRIHRHFTCKDLITR